METDVSQSDGEQRATRPSPLFERLTRVVFIAFLLAVVAYLTAMAIELNVNNPQRDAFHIDFVAFWAAAKLAAAGQAVSAFDLQALQAAQSLPPQDAQFDHLYWHYPPAFQLLLMPLGYLGFSPALAVFTVCGLAVYICALRGWTRENLGRLHLGVAAPPAGFVLITGNASLLWAGGLLIALGLLCRGRELRAGIAIALLTLKPQLGLLIPVALIAGRHWRALISAALAAAAIAALTLVVFGPDYWQTFFASLRRTTGLYAVYGENAVTMITWYAFLRQFGVGHESAVALQFGVLALNAGVVAYLWSRRAVASDLKLAVLCLASLLATPYAHQYELMLAVLAALFLARAGLGGSVPGRIGLAILWLLPVPGWLIGGLEIAQYAAPVLTLALALTTAAALRPARN